MRRQRLRAARNDDPFLSTLDARQYTNSLENDVNHIKKPIESMTPVQLETCDNIVSSLDESIERNQDLLMDKTNTSVDDTFDFGWEKPENRIWEQLIEEESNIEHPTQKDEILEGKHELKHVHSDSHIEDAIVHEENNNYCDSIAHDNAIVHEDEGLTPYSNDSETVTTFVKYTHQVENSFLISNPGIPESNRESYSATNRNIIYNPTNESISETCRTILPDQLSDNQYYVEALPHQNDMRQVDCIHIQALSNHVSHEETHSNDLFPKENSIHVDANMISNEDYVDQAQYSQNEFEYEEQMFSHINTIHEANLQNGINPDLHINQEVENETNDLQIDGNSVNEDCVPPTIVLQDFDDLDSSLPIQEPKNEKYEEDNTSSSCRESATNDGGDSFDLLFLSKPNKRKGRDQRKKLELGIQPNSFNSNISNNLSHYNDFPIDSSSSNKNIESANPGQMKVDKPHQSNEGEPNKTFAEIFETSLHDAFDNMQVTGPSYIENTTVNEIVPTTPPNEDVAVIEYKIEVDEPNQNAKEEDEFESMLGIHHTMKHYVQDIHENTEVNLNVGNGNEYQRYDGSDDQIASQSPNIRASQTQNDTQPEIVSHSQFGNLQTKTRKNSRTSKHESNPVNLNDTPSTMTNNSPPKCEIHSQDNGEKIYINRTKTYDYRTTNFIQEDNGNNENRDLSNEKIRYNREQIENQDSILGDRYNVDANIIHSISIITFDLEIGQKVQQVYPDYRRKDLPSDIPYLSFPDSNTSVKLEELLFYFTIGSGKMIVTNPESPHEGDCTNKSPYYGYVYFAQQNSIEIDRGCIMKSVVIISKYPFLSLFKRVVQVIGRAYWRENPTRDIVQEVLWDGLRRAFEEILKWQEDAEGNIHVNIFSLSFKYQIPHIPGFYAIRKEEKIDFKFDKNGQVRCASVMTPLKQRLRGKGYLFQKEISIYSIFYNHLDNLIHFWELMLLGEPILVLSPSPDQCSKAVLGLISLISPIPYGGEHRPYFTIHNTEYKSFSKMGEFQGFESVILGVTNPFFLKTYDKWPNYIAVGNSSLEGDSPNLNASPSQKKRISTAFSFVSNIVRLKPKSNVKTSEEAKNKLMWQFEEILWSKRKFILKKDSSWQSKLVHLDNSEILNDDMNSTLKGNDNQIFLYFEKLTEAFLFPLQKCFDSLLFSMKTFLFRSDHRILMKAETFSAYVQKHGYKNEIFSASHESVLELYSKFIFSRNFQNWLDNQILEAYTNEVIHSTAEELRNKFSDVELIDCFFRLQEDIAELRQQSFPDKMIINKLEQLYEDIMVYVPEQLRPSLERVKVSSEDLSENKNGNDI